MMLNRIVKMTFESDKIELFLAYLPQYQAAIRQSPGCRYLQILRDTQNPCIVFTYSHWENAESLDQYRNSPLFQTVWAQVRQWFAEKPQAWSLQTVAELS